MPETVNGGIHPTGYLTNWVPQNDLVDFMNEIQWITTCDLVDQCDVRVVCCIDKRMLMNNEICIVYTSLGLENGLAEYNGLKIFGITLIYFYFKCNSMTTIVQTTTEILLVKKHRKNILLHQINNFYPLDL